MKFLKIFTLANLKSQKGMFPIKFIFRGARPLVPRVISNCNYANEARKAVNADASSTVTLPPADETSTATTDKSSASQTLDSPEISKDKETIDYVVKPPDMFIKLEPVTQMPDNAVRSSLSFDEVPGPQSLRHIARFWSFVPVLGTQVTASTIQYLLSAGKIFGSQLSWGSNLWVFRRLMDEYGPVVRLHGPFGGDVVILSRPEHANAVFQSEGRYPIRSNLDCLEKYRLQFRRYKHAGPFLMYGPEWEKLRKSIERPLNDSTTKRLNELEKSCDEFVTRIERIRNVQEEVPPTFINEIKKWALDCLCTLTLNKHIGFLDPHGLNYNSEPALLLDNLQGATDAIRKCEHGLHLWKFIETPAWRSLVKHCDVIDTIFSKYIRKVQEGLRQKKVTTGTFAATESASLVESLLLTEDVITEDVLTVLLDMVLIGVNTMSHSIAFLMYHLACNPRVQRKLYEEVKNSPVQLTKGDLSKMSYLKACIKESLRLKPPMPVLSRILSKDVVIHNYRIPKGTYILIAAHLSSLREEHFEDSLRFKPERWLDSDPYADDINLLATIPFGHGPKACLARELAETEIALLIIKVLQKYRIEYYYGEINSTNRLLAAPNRPLKYRFVERT